MSGGPQAGPWQGVSLLCPKCLEGSWVHPVWERLDVCLCLFEEMSLSDERQLSGLVTVWDSLGLPWMHTWELRAI